MVELLAETDRIAAVFSGDALASEFVGLADIQAACLVMAARRRGIATSRVWSGDESCTGWWLRLETRHGLAYCREGRILVGFDQSKPEECSRVNSRCRTLLVDKPATKQVLDILGVPTPAGQEFLPGQTEEALGYALSRGAPVCVKATRGSLGIGIFPNLAGPDEIRRALAAADEFGQGLLVEDHLPGEAARFIFVRPNVVAARRDLPANVVGDGRSSVAQLLAVKNVHKRLRSGQAPVLLGERERAILASQGMAEDDVPDVGRRVFLRNLSNRSQGGESMTWTGPICESYAAEIARFCNTLPGLHIAAVDTIIADPSSRAAPDSYAVLELNAAPGVVGFHFPWQGEPQEVVETIMDWLLGGDAWADA